MDCVCYGYVRFVEEMDMIIVVFIFIQFFDDVWYISLLIVYVIGFYVVCLNSVYNLILELQYFEKYFDCIIFCYLKFFLVFNFV